ncbi:MAG: hypothetical protein AABM67_17770 [Acidobacteriota bacterium]
MLKRHSKTSSLILSLALLILAILGCRSTNPTNSPSWTKARVLSEKEDHPSKIISDGQSIFFVTGGTVASMKEGTNNIKKISLRDGSISVLVKGGERIPSGSLAVDNKYLYWSDGGNILRVPKEGGESEKIIEGAPNPDEMLVDGENIYWLIWAGEGSPPQPIMVAPRIGGSAKQLTPPQPPTSGLAIDSDFVYWMTGSGIQKISKKGGEITEVYHNSSKTPSLGLLSDADNFYYAQMNTKGKSALMKFVRKTGEVTQLAPSINHVYEFIMDDTNVYCFDEIPGTGSFGPIALKKVPKAGGAPTVLDQGQAGWIKYLAVDATHIYFTDIAKVYALSK